MNKKNYLIITGVLTAIIGGSIPYVQSTHAQGSPFSTNNLDLVTKIATKFNLNQNEVQTVFDEERAQKRAEKQKNIEEKLTEEVKNGNITEAQKQIIIEHQKNNQIKMEEIRNMTDEAEKKSAIEKLREENMNWAKEHSINQKYLCFGKQMGQARSGKHMRGAIN